MTPLCNGYEYESSIGFPDCKHVMAALLRVPGCNPNMSPAETSVGKHSQGGCSRKSHCVLVQPNCSQGSRVRAAVSGGNVNITNTATCNLALGPGCGAWAAPSAVNHWISIVSHCHLWRYHLDVKQCNVWKIRQG